MEQQTLTSAEVIQELLQQIQEDAKFATLLTASVATATALAKTTLDKALYAALDELYSGCGWPVDAAGYINYLTYFAQVIPSENTNTDFDPWQNTDSQNGYSQEVYDRLCHFYWLVDQGADGVTLQDYTNPATGFSFAAWLDSYAAAWGTFLDTAESLTPETLQSFQNDPEYNLADYSDDQPNWKSFNTFFYRQLNATRPDGTPMRPVANPNDNSIICSPADCTYKQYYKIDGSGNVLDDDDNPTAVCLKKTHSIGNINDLLSQVSPEYVEKFYNGTFVHYFLSPFDYHRFHTPVSGNVLALEAVPGRVYLNVTIDKQQFNAPDSSGDGYEFTQARGVLVLDSNDPAVGYVAVAPIGMAQVSSVSMNTQLVGQQVVKGQEFGHFAFGGSDIILLFQQPISQLKLITQVANAEVTGSYANAAPFHFKYGEPSVIILPA